MSPDTLETVLNSVVGRLEDALENVASELHRLRVLKEHELGLFLCEHCFQVFEGEEASIRCLERHCGDCK